MLISNARIWHAADENIAHFSLSDIYVKGDGEGYYKQKVRAWYTLGDILVHEMVNLWHKRRECSNKR